MEKLLTIFTPTYNRAISLHVCYKSLVSQSKKNFVWQIVDDGSTDETEAIVRKWQQEDIIPIFYTKKKNGGKVSAINKSLEMTDTVLWLCLDSDDYLLPDACDLIAESYVSIASDDNVCGIFSLRTLPCGKAMQGKEIPYGNDYVTQSYVRYTLRIPPEYAHVFKTSVISKYKYPEVDGERYFPLSYVYDQVDIDYSYKVLRKGIMVCEYRDDGITKNKRNLIKKNPIGYMIYKEQLSLLAPSFIDKMKACSTFIAACILADKRNPFKSKVNKFHVLICLPVGVLDYLIRYKFGLNLNFESSLSRVSGRKK